MCRKKTVGPSQYLKRWKITNREAGPFDTLISISNKNTQSMMLLGMNRSIDHRSLLAYMQWSTGGLKKGHSEAPTRQCKARQFNLLASAVSRSLSLPFSIFLYPFKRHTFCAVVSLWNVRMCFSFELQGYAAFMPNPGLCHTPAGLGWCGRGLHN